MHARPIKSAEWPGLAKIRNVAEECKATVFLTVDHDKLIVTVTTPIDSLWAANYDDTSEFAPETEDHDLKCVLTHNADENAAPVAKLVAGMDQGFTECDDHVCSTCHPENCGRF